MPEQILPVQGLDQLGLIADAPATTLPPNAFSDAANVRFRDGAVTKMEGEVNIFPDVFSDTEQILKYVAWWPNPNLTAQHSGYYLYISQHQDSDGREMDHVYLTRPGDTEGVLKGIFQPDSVGNWQHTLFQGGFCIIINNGIDTPFYILDNEGNTDINMVPDFHVLPGWQNYLLNQVLLEDRFDDSDQRIFDFGQLIDFTTVQVIVEKQTYDAMGNVTADSEIAIQRGESGHEGTGTPNDTDYVPGILPSGELNFERGFQIYLDSETNTHVMWLGQNDVNVRDGIRVRLRSRERVHVRAAVVRAFGDFLVAANLFEVEESDNDVVIRRLPGVVRTSDAAEPGSVPNNWNPYAVGVSTANEFTTTQSGVVQDMVQLQGNLYIYSNDGIFVMDNPRGGFPQQPRPVANGWGALTTNAVQEFDGQHFVVGSGDIYVFGGHPGNIQSVADGRTRNYFFDNLNPFHVPRVFVLRHQLRDEMWLCFPSKRSISGECDTALIWNYRLNNWTIRELRNVRAGDVAPLPGGGVPNVLIDLDGVSGDNGIVNIGAIEVQGFLMDSDDYLAGDTDGRKSLYQINVANVPRHNFTGRPLFDWEFSSDIVTGSNPPYMTFNGFDSENRVVTSLHVRMPANLEALATDSERRSAFLAAFEAHPTMDSEINWIITRDNDREIVFEFRNTRVVTASITIGSRTRYEQSDLVRDSEYDTGNSASGAVMDTDNTYCNYVSTFTVRREAYEAGTWYFPDTEGFPNGTIFTIATLSDSEWLYDPAGGIGDSDTEDMYFDTDGNNRQNDSDRWHDRRPVIPGSSMRHYMYQARDVDDSDRQITGPFQPPTWGVFDIQIRVPKVNGACPTFNGYTLKAYMEPDDSHTGMNITQALLDPRRHSFEPILRPGQVLDTENIPPIIAFTQFRFNYTPFPVDDFTTRVDDTVVYVALAGDYDTDQATRIAHAGEAIAHVFHDSESSGGASFFLASDSDNGMVYLESIENGKHEIDTDVVYYGDSEMFDITVMRRQSGLWNVSTSMENLSLGIVQAVYPSLRITAPDTLQSYDIQLTNPGTGQVAPSAILQQIVDVVDSEASPGWSSTALPANYAQITGDTEIRLVAATDIDARRPSARPINGTWAFEIVSFGNTDANRGDSEWLPNFKTTRDTEQNYARWGYTGNVNAVDFRGAYLERATPTYLGLLIYNSQAGVASNLETLILEAGGPGDYNPNDQSGTNNGTTEMPEPIAERWISEIRISNNRLSVIDRGTEGQFLLQPANYDDTASFVLEAFLNDTDSNATRIQQFYEGRVEYPRGSGTFVDVARNPRSANIWYNLDTDILRRASNSPGIVVDNADSQINPSATRSPNRRGTDTDYATMTTPPIAPRDQLFDVDRPWPQAEVNLNQYRPIFAGHTLLDSDNGSGGVIQRTYNKLIGADIGWSYPLYTTKPRVETYAGVDLILDSDGSDAPRPYRSFVFREDLPISPEFETESVAGAAFWINSEYKPSFFGDLTHNRLTISMFSTDVPNGFYTAPRSGPARNIFYPIDDYKLDYRINGRFIHMYFGDQWGRSFQHTESEVVNGRTYDQKTPWRLSGVQLKISTGGRR